MTSVVDTKHELLMRSVGESESGMLVMTVLATARRIDAACAEILAEYGLSEGRFAALLAVEETPGLSPAQLAERIGVTRDTVTGLLDGLVTAGLITRRVQAKDRRAQTLQMTPAGAELVSVLVPEYRSWLHDAAVAIASADQTAAVKVMATLQRNLADRPSQ